MPGDKWRFLLIFEFVKMKTFSRRLLNMIHKMKEENDMSLFVFWPKSEPETDYFEQQYALKFCKIYLHDSLQKHNLLFNWADVDYGGTETPHHQLTKYVLVIKDPLVILNGTMSSRQGEFHPEPLTEPYVTVSRHTALVIQIYEIKLSNQLAND
ncbi:MAG: hypothetical protein HQ541_13105, partial [Mariniphaga sp.]|nr:hypothetical protein [Mariniphaga sp.]